MNIHYIFSLLAVVILFLAAYLGVEAAGLQMLFGVFLPYLAVIIFLAGVTWRIMGWARVPVPFRIPTTCGQHKSMDWFKQDKIDCPSTKAGVILRMVFEILFFRSLFRNTRMRLQDGAKMTYQMELFLWAAALAFHWSFLTVLIRHMRFFLEPVPAAISFLETVDSFFRIEISLPIFQIGLPGFYISGLVLLAAVTYLLSRRIFIPHVKYISLASDFFPLFLIIGIAASGIVMRYVTKVDITAIKALAMGLVTFHPQTPEGIGGFFYAHLFLVTVLLIYFPFSKLMHMGGVFLSPTRNMTTNTREVRHVNPWNYPVAVHTYDEYEDEFREKMVEVGLPVEKQPQAEPAADAEGQKEKE